MTEYTYGVQKVEVNRVYKETKPAALQGRVNTVGGTMLYTPCDGSLNPLALDRIVALKNTGDQDATVNIYPYMKSLGWQSANITLSLTVKKNNGVCFVSNGQLNEISAPFDSITLGVNYATLPTTGGINVTVAEVSAV